MKNDPQAERALGALISRKHKESETAQLKEALEEISRLRGKGRRLIGELRKVAVEALHATTSNKINKIASDYENEY